MTRVSDNSSSYAVNYSLAKTKSKLEDLQIKGSNLKNIQKPSDNPSGSTEVLTMRSRKADAEQYAKNSVVAKTQLEYTENALSDLTDVMVRAKELAVAQASQTYNADSRKSVAEEVNQLYLQALSITNKRLGSRYIFSGTKTLTQPFDELGRYHGDNGRVHLEVGKDRYIPVNITGSEVSEGKPADVDDYQRPAFEEKKEKVSQRTLASEDLNDVRMDKSAMESEEKTNSPLGKSAELFADLKSFHNALLTDNPDIVRNLLEKFDAHIEETVKLRTKIGSLVNSLNNSELQNERDQVMQQEHMSKIEDADVMELYTDLQKQQSVLDATYRTGANLLNKNLLQFLN